MAHGFDPVEVVRAAHGRPSRSTIADLLPNCDVQKEDREVERMEIEDLEGVVPLPGSIELLRSLPPDRWTIATSCTRPLAEVRLRAAGLPIPKTMITSSEVTNGKPAPEPYLKAAAILNVAPSDCVVVEDVPAGIRSGRAAGARVIAYTTTMERRELEEAGANWILRNPSEVKAGGKNDALVLEIPG
jgi:sugar-phosphatase